MGRAGPARPMKNEPNGLSGRAGTICTIKYTGPARPTIIITVHIMPVRPSKCNPLSLYSILFIMNSDFTVNCYEILLFIG